MSPDQEDENDDAGRARELIETGSELAGAVTGAAIGLVGGPPGAVAGAAAGVAITRVAKKVGTEIHDRVMGPRQRVRVGAAYAWAHARIAERMRAGERPRADWFKQEEQAARSDAEELLEGVLLQAANAWQERKVKYIGVMYASFGFAPDISAAYASFLLHLADRLTYRQLVCLALLASRRYDDELMKIDAARSEGDARSSQAIVGEFDGLGAMGLIGVEQQNEYIAMPSDVIGPGTFATLDLARAKPTRLGQALHDLMCLAEIAGEEQNEILAELGGRSSSG